MKVLKYKTLGALAFVQAVKTVNALLAATAKTRVTTSKNCAHNYYTCVQLCKCMYVGWPAISYYFSQAIDWQVSVEAVFKLKVKVYNLQNYNSCFYLLISYNLVFVPASKLFPLWRYSL